MAYIGKQPVIGNFVKLDAISVVNGQASYTMQNGGANFTEYANVNQFLVSLNGILQSPTDSFTVSGSTITFASNLVTGDVIDFIIVLGNTLDVGVPSDNTVSTAKLQDSSVSLAKLTATGTKDATTFLRGDNTFAEVVSGLTVADQWRITANKSLNNTSNVYDTNLEQVDGASQGTLGTSMSVSSGEFTYPSTGTYLVISNSTFQNSNTSSSYYVYTEHQNSTTGSNFVTTSQGYVYFYVPAGTNTATATGIDVVNVTNTSNVKTRFLGRSMNSCQARGDTSINFTSFTFIRLGDST